MKKFAVILLALSLTTAVFAAGKANPEAKPAKVVSMTVVDPNLITGTVTDKNTNEALAGAVVVCDDQKAYTDLDGNFSIRKTKKASELTVRLISYSTLTLKLNDIQEGRVSVGLRQQ